MVLLDSPHPKPPKKLSPILGRKGSPAFRIKRSSGDVKADVSGCYYCLVSINCFIVVGR